MHLCPRVSSDKLSWFMQVLIGSDPMPEGSETIKGYDFNEGVDYHALLSSFSRTGFQATNFGKAVDEVNRMRTWRLSDEPIADDEDEELKDPKVG